MPVTRCWRAGSGNQRRRHRGERCHDRTDKRAGRLSRQLHRDARSRVLARIAEVMFSVCSAMAWTGWSKYTVASLSANQPSAPLPLPVISTFSVV